jgi:hypothetical protein
MGRVEERGAGWDLEKNLRKFLVKVGFLTKSKLSPPGRRQNQFRTHRSVPTKRLQTLRVR